MAARALDRLRAPLLALGLFAACFVVFAPALSGGFLLWDDTDTLLVHAHWRGFGLDELRWMFAAPQLGHYHPLTWASYALDWQLFGLDPRAFHRTNVLLHALNAVLCFLCARELLRRHFPAPDLGAAAAAALFALHPLRVESVAWITERRDVLSGFFLLVSLRAWLVHTEGSKGRAAYALALAAYAASLLSKASAVGWPLVLLALDVGRQPRGPLRSRLKELLPFLALACVCALLALFASSQLGTAARWSEHGLGGRLAQASYGWLFYPLQTLAVVGVQPVYELVLPLDLREPRFLAALVIAPALSLALWTRRRRWPFVWAALLAYTLLVAPLLGLVQNGPQLVAARYSYLPCIPLALLAGAAAARLPRPLALAALLVALLPGWSAYADTRVWQSDRALWTHARELDPSSRVALRNLVAAVYAEKRFEEGLALCGEWQQLGEDPEQWNARGSLLAALGHDEAALDALYRSLERSHMAESNLITLLVRLGRSGEALPLCQAWTARAPRSAEAWAALGHVRTELGHAQPALAALDRALALDRDLSGAALDRGLVLAALGRREEARAAFTEVLRSCAPEHPDAQEARMQLERLGQAPAGVPMR